MAYALVSGQAGDEDGVRFTGARTANTVSFRLLGGKYAWAQSAASTSSALSLLMPDGSTYQSISALTTSAAYTVLDLPPGSYNITFVATSDVQGSVTKVPYNPAY